MRKTILVTGSTGYIGSHIVYLLVQHNYHVIGLDNTQNCHKLDHPLATYIHGDYGNQNIITNIFKAHTINTVIHCGASTNLRASLKDPLDFYQNNVTKTIILTKTMLNHHVKKIIFSSSCAVYGRPQYIPIDENHPCQPINPYGNTKLCTELMLHDLGLSNNLSSIIFRFFNVAGGWPAYNLFENHQPETHIIPVIFNAIKNNKPVYLFGDDHDTPDGTCIRDFVHVRDVAQAHLRALEYLETGQVSDCFNIGSGHPVSLLELLNTMEKLYGTIIKKEFKPKNSGDPPKLVANCQKAQDILGWKPRLSNLNSILNSTDAQST